jgi:alpha-beta hydrolase superfamily lysophospholipase
MSIFDSHAFNERLFFPRRDVSTPPAGATDLEIAVPGATLHLRWHRPPSARATVLLFHGNGEVVADYDDAAETFAAAGASLAVVDFRGYGASTGTPTLRSALSDAPLVLQAMLEKRGIEPLLVMGRSLGSACANELYGMQRADIAGFILESGASDLVGLVRRRGLDLRPFDQNDLDVFDPIPKLQRGTQPLLVLHGAIDEMIAPAEAKQAFAAAGTKKKNLVLIPGHGHNDISASPLYWSALRDFVAEVA